MHVRAEAENVSRNARVTVLSLAFGGDIASASLRVGERVQHAEDQQVQQQEVEHDERARTTARQQQTRLRGTVGYSMPTTHHTERRLVVRAQGVVLALLLGLVEPLEGVDRRLVLCAVLLLVDHLPLATVTRRPT